MSVIPEVARRAIVEMSADTLVEFFAHCIDQDELDVAEYISDNLYDTLDLAHQQAIWLATEAGQQRAMEQALEGATLQ